MAALPVAGAEVEIALLYLHRHQRARSDPTPPPLQEEHMGSLVWSSALKPDGRLSDRDSYVMFHPSDRRVPHMLIARGDLPSIFVDNPGAYANSIFMACVKGTWSGSSKLPWGHNVRFVGEAGAIHAETKALLSQHGMYVAIYEQPQHPCTFSGRLALYFGIFLCLV